MSSIQELLERFETASNKVDVLHQLEVRQGPHVAAFFARIVRDESLPMELRIDALQGLRVKGFADSEDKRRVADAIVEVLAEGDDNVVRGYCGNALSNFLDCPGVLDAIARAVSDPAEDEDVRHNAFEGLEDHPDDLRVRRVSAECAGLAGLQDSIGQAVRRLEARRKGS